MQKNMKLTSEQQLLVENNLSVVHWVIVNSIHVNPCIYGMSYEDLFQEGCIWLCRAAVTYNAAKALFSTYAKKVVRNGLISYCRRQCDKEKHYVHLEVGENGELLMGEADCSGQFYRPHFPDRNFEFAGIQKSCLSGRRPAWYRSTCT